ncbi:MAG TPA: SDR family oxidoreductase [Myxococcota bacterium]|nr:SDR family oxidoreductase [Myxococcota bacterium]
MPYQSGFVPGLFRERTIVVTGGGSGLGRCIAHELVALGAKVALVGRTPEKLARVEHELAAEGGAAASFTCDVRDEMAITAAVSRILERFGRIDGLVNHAGGQFQALLRDLSLNGWNAVVANNATGSFLCSREVYRQWMEAHGGAIVCVGADHELGMPGMGHAGAARAAQANFVQTASVEWAHAGVRVNHVIPGYFASSGLDAYPASQASALRAVAKRIPMKRHGTEAELSAAVVFLLSPMAAYVTGATLRVDGGVHNAVGEYYRVPDHERAPRWEGFHLAEPPAALRGERAEEPPRP